MKNNTLIKLRDNITGTYSDEDIIWLIKELDDYETEKSFLKAHSREELVSRAMEGHRQIQNGECYTNEEAMAMYDEHAKEALELMKRKNHDYDEAWRGMRVSSYTDLILTKIERIKEIENLQGETLVSEGIDANYMDIINYAVFGVIKLTEESDDATA